MIEPDEAEVEAAAKAIDDNYNPDRYPVMAAMFRDYAKAALSAAIPLLAQRIAGEIAEQVEALPTSRTQAWETGWYSVSLKDVLSVIREYGEVVTDEQEA